MLALRALTPLAALASVVLALPAVGADDGPPLIVGKDAIPTLLSPTYTRPTEPPATLRVRQTDVAVAAEVDPCSLVRCAGGTVCEVRKGTAYCVPGVPCGPTTCPRSEVCCNQSCGICTPPGGFCIQLWCGDVAQS